MLMMMMMMMMNPGAGAIPHTVTLSCLVVPSPIAAAGVTEDRIK